ncbi:MAG: DUF1080 domain-containing protein [Fibrobacteria bacterium]
MKNRIFVAVSIIASMGTLHAQTAPNALTECEKQEGFRLMFDGTNADTFRKNFTEYKQNSADTAQPISSNWKVDAPSSSITNSQSNTPDIRTKVTYKDFDWRMQYRNSGNQGVLYRFLLTQADAWQTGVEMAIEDNVNIANQKTAAGAVYDMFAPAKKVYNAYASEKWNDLRVVAKGDSVEHWMNGEKIAGFRFNNATWNTARANSKWKDFPNYCRSNAADPTSTILDGYLGIQGNHGGTWKLRTIRLNNASATIAFGAEKTGCSSDINPARARSVKGAFSFLRSTRSVSVSLPDSRVDEVSLIALDGREVAHGKVDMSMRTVNLSGWSQSGVYLVKTFASGRPMGSGKIFLQ